MVLYIYKNCIRLSGYVCVSGGGGGGGGNKSPSPPPCSHSWPSKHAGSDYDPEAFWLRPVMAFTASVQPESGRIYMPDLNFPHPFQLHFSKEGMDHTSCAKPTRIRSEWPGQGLAKRIWSRSKLLCRNHRDRFLAGRNGLLPVSDFRIRFRSTTDVLDNTVQNQPGSDLVLVD